MVRINGKEIDAAGMTIGEYIQKASYSQERTVVELNNEIVRKQQYGDIILNDGDTVEIVSFVGGG